MEYKMTAKDGKKSPDKEQVWQNRKMKNMLEK